MSIDPNDWVNLRTVWRRIGTIVLLVGKVYGMWINMFIKPK